MKKIIVVFIFTFNVIFTISALELDVYSDRTVFEQFKILTAEEQYNSIINSFREHMGIDRIIIWANQMISQYDREVLPYIYNTLSDLNLGILRSSHRDYILDIEQYILNIMIEENILSENDKKIFIVLIQNKIDEYILKYRVIDYPVGNAIDILYVLGYSFETEDEEVLTSDTPLKVYYEKKLGIKGLLYSDLNEYTILDSPLAEFITD